MLGGCRYCTFEILIANPIDGRPESKQPNLGFIKYDVHATCLVY